MPLTVQPVTPVKRRRIELACKLCRSRKTKCDGKQPTCSPCARSKISCQYEATIMQKKPRNTGVIQSENIGTLDVWDVLQPDMALAEAAVDSQSTDAFGRDTTQGADFFGPSSNHEHFRSLSRSFVQVAKSQYSKKEKQLKAWSKERETSMLRSEPATVLHSVSDHYSMPNDNHAQHLFDSFFSTTNLIMPYVDKHTLLQSYNHVKHLQARQAHRNLWSLINIIWALASSSLERPESEMYYRRAVSLLDAHTIRKTSLELVQALLLLASFQQNHQRSVASWTYHSLAVKSVFQLGLHSPASYTTFSEHDRELRKRLWFGVLLQDRVLSVSLGRPTLIPEYHNRIEGLDSPRGGSLSLHDDGLTFFKHKISMCSIIYRTMETLYDHNIGSNSRSLNEIIVARTDLILQLSEWRDSILPFTIISESKLTTDDNSTFDSNRFEILLSIYYYRSVLLANRAVLEKFLAQFILEEDGNISQVIWQSLQIILLNNQQCALELQKIFTLIYKKDIGFLRRHATWWTVNYSVFSTGMHLLVIMIFALRFPTLRTSIDELGVRHALEESLETLQNIGKTSQISWKGRECMMRYLEGYDILVSEERSNLPTTQNDLWSHNDSVSGVTVAHTDSSAIDSAWMSISDFFSSTAEDFFSIDMDFLQDDFFRFTG